MYVTEAYTCWLHAALKGYFTEYSTVVDIGVGVGRSAQVLRDLIFCGDTFKGTYIGIDIDEVMNDWCPRYFDNRRFRFHYSIYASVGDQQKGCQSGSYSIPEPDGSVDLVFSRAWYTKIFSRRSWKTTCLSRSACRGLVVMPYTQSFVWSIRRRHSAYGIRSRTGDAYVESMKVPAVAYTFQEQLAPDYDPPKKDSTVLTNPDNVESRL